MNDLWSLAHPVNMLQRIVQVLVLLLVAGVAFVVCRVEQAKEGQRHYEEFLRRGTQSW